MASDIKEMLDMEYVMGCCGRQTTQKILDYSFGPKLVVVNIEPQFLLFLIDKDLFK